MIRDAARAAVWLLPASQAKNFVLRRLGHNVHPHARARSNFVWKVEAMELGNGSRIGRWNIVKNMKRVRLGGRAVIAHMNLISAHPVYVRGLPDGGVLEVGAHATVMSRHSLDCSARVDIGPFVCMAGHDTRIVTHSIDLKTDTQAAIPVCIGERSFVATRCVLLGGGVVPARSVLAAGAVLVGGANTEPGLYAGVPARRVKDIDGAWFDRDQGETRRIVVETPDGMVERAF